VPIVRRLGKEPLNTTELIKDLAKVKRKQAPLWEHLGHIDHPAFFKIRACGSYLELREWLDHDGKCTVQTANFCKNHVMCNMCAIRRSARLCQAYEAKVLQVLSDPETAHLKPVMITITIKNREDINDAFNHLKHSFTRLQKRAIEQKHRKKPPAVMDEFTKIKGGVYAFEIKKGKGGLWHPHIHFFALIEEYIDQEKLSNEWFDITGDSFVVGVTACKNGVLKGLIEVLKYTTKFSEMKPSDIVEIADMARNRTLCSPVGILRGVKVQPIDEDDQLDGDYIDYIAHFLYRKNGYRLKLKTEVHETVDEIMTRHHARVNDEFNTHI
jgi:hypothetical protein